AVMIGATPTHRSGRLAGPACPCKMRAWLTFIANFKMNIPHVLSRRPKTPTQERGERRVTDLLSAAEHLFATNGYDATPMSGIAQLAGASIGSLYQFFPS